MQGAHENEWFNKQMNIQWDNVFPEGTSQQKSWTVLDITEEKINTAVAIIWEDRHLSIRDLAVLINILKIIIHRILTEHLKMWCVCST